MGLGLGLGLVWRWGWRWGWVWGWGWGLEGKGFREHVRVEAEFVVVTRSEGLAGEWGAIGECGAVGPVGVHEVKMRGVAVAGGGGGVDWI